MVVRDFYFVVFLIEHGYTFNVIRGRVVVDITKPDYNIQLARYKSGEVAKYCKKVKEISRLVDGSAIKRYFQLSDLCKTDENLKLKD
jgi:hypothetical protein